MANQEWVGTGEGEVQGGRVHALCEREGEVQGGKNHKREIAGSLREG